MPDCPTRVILEHFLAGELGDDGEHALSAHLDRCASCQGELARLVDGPAVHRSPFTESDATGRDLDLSFLDRLRMTSVDPAWTPPRWDQVTGGLTLSAGLDLSRSRGNRDPVPGYEILGELGRGAMGVVYKARQLSLGRLTALKMILGGEQAGVDDRVRFRAEAEAAGSLRHPNIVQVYEIGEAGGLLFFSMEYIEGQTLKQRLRGTPQPARAAALLLETLARAADYAHRCGIVHRDLKPANVMLETVDLPPCSGLSTQNMSLPTELAGLGLVPKITDFGLAKRVGDTLGTQTGQLLGTPTYMSPEQLAGQTGPAAPAVDLYALGCILYESLTGRPPLLDASLEALAARVQREEPIPPRRLQPRCPRDLETICLKCLEKQPARRYASAAELADDLARFLAGEPVLARPPSALDRWGKLARRHRAFVVGVSAVMAALAVGIAAAGVMAVRETRAAAGRPERAPSGD